MKTHWLRTLSTALAVCLGEVCSGGPARGTTNIELPLPPELSHWKAFYCFSESGRSGVIAVPAERYENVVISLMDPFIVQKEEALTHWDQGTRRFFGIVLIGGELEVTNRIDSGNAYFLKIESSSFSKVYHLKSSNKYDWSNEIAEFIINEEMHKQPEATPGSAP